MKKNTIVRVKALIFIFLIILTNYIQIMFLTLGSVRIIDFRCDAEFKGNKTYETDVNTTVNFIYDAEDYLDAYVNFGDGTGKAYLNLTSRFSHTYTMEGIYNVTLWVVGPGGWVTESLTLDILNRPPEFDIGYTSVEYHEATFAFEDHQVGDLPNGWSIYNNDFDFYLDNGTNLYAGTTLEGGVNNLTIEDQKGWIIQSELINPRYRFISLELDFDEIENHYLTPGYYELYFSANETMNLLCYNPKLGENEILYSGTYTQSEVIYIADPDTIELFTNFYVEGGAIDPEIIEIDWFKLVRVDKGVKIIKDQYDHGNVIEMNFGSSSQFCGIQNDFSSLTSGAIEFWYKTNDTKMGGRIFSITEKFGIVQCDNDWYVNDIPMSNPVYSDFPLPQNNTWYHVRIEWQGLGFWVYKVYINNYPSKVDFNMLYDDISSINFETNGTIYIDAIGFSWDPDYSIGDNFRSIYPAHLYEDLEIKFSVINLIESEIDKNGFSYNSEEDIKENFQYFWDFGDGNYSYKESPTHKFENAGEYPVRLTLIDDQGAMSTVVSEFKIENKKPQSSILYGLNYDATYDFKFDISDAPPPSWYTHGNIKVIDFRDEFSKVVEIDNTQGGYGMIRIPEPKLGYNGSIEFWVYFTDINEDEFFFWTDKLNFSDQNPFCIKNSTRFGFLNGKWMYYYHYLDAQNHDKYAYAEISELELPKNNKWTHIRFDYCWSDNVKYKGLSGKQWRLFINGNASNVYDGVGDDFNRKGFDIKSGSHIYLESIGFTTDLEYNLGANNPPREKSYFGTWDFRYYPIGPIPYDESIKSTVLGPWMFGSYNFEKIADNCSCNIIPEIEGHKKVLELNDNNEEDYVFASLFDFAESKYGTIEFWLRTTDTFQGLIMALGYEVFDSGIWLGSNGSWWHKDGNEEVEITDIPTMQNNTWHHIRVDFECRKNGGYLGLNEGEFLFWVDQIISKSGPFRFDYNVSNFGWNIWSTEKVGKNYSIFLDAVGASWDPSYEIGDNLEPREGYLSDIEIILSASSSDTPTDKDSLLYLWNFGDNQTGFGQTVLHTYSRSGKFKVRLTTIDDNALYDISEEYLWIDNLYPSINISKLTYGLTTFDFSTDNINEFPEGWYRSALEEILGNLTKVVSEVDGYFKVVQIGDGPGVGGIFTCNCSGLPYNQTYGGTLNLTHGTVEFWLYTNDTYNSNIYISLFVDNYLDGIFIEFTNGTWKHGNSVITFGNYWNLENNTWAHLRIDFSCDESSYMDLENDTFIIYGDGSSSPVLNMLHNNHPNIQNITCFGIFTDMQSNEYGQVFVDNFGFSWDPDYNIGDNKFSFVQYQFNEGETIILESISYDTYKDYQQLIYNWGGLYLDIHDFVDLGWCYSHTFFNNNDEEPIIALVQDPLFIWDIDYYNVSANNILPSFDITSVNIVSNLSISIFNGGNEGANFSISLISDDYNSTFYLANYPSNSPSDWVIYNSTQLILDISKNWDILVNQTGREGGEHFFVINFLFDNGYNISRSYNFDGGQETWLFNLNEMWINQSNSLSKVPLIFEASMNDPSNDKIDLSINYGITTLHEVDPSTPLLNKNYIIQNIPFNINCSLRIFEEDSTKFAQIEFIEIISKTWKDQLLSGAFPVSYYFNFTADMTDIDIYNFINEIFTNESISNPVHLYTQHFILANYNEIGPLSKIQSNKINFNISTNFEFENLAPNIEIFAPVKLIEDQTVELFARVNDFNGDDVSVNASFGINHGYGLLYNDLAFFGNNLYGFNYSYKNAGKYLITVLAYDGKEVSKAIHLIEIVNQAPYAKIRTFQNSTVEDQLVEFKADFYDTPSDIRSLRYYWDFGDGVFSTEKNPFHAYINSGYYKVRLFVKDDNGATYCSEHEIMVNEQNPEIEGPYSFTGFEGHSIILDVNAKDSISDSLMDYEWDIYKARKIYNSTFNFMDVLEGDRPGLPDFEYFDTNDILYQVIDELAGHYKVLEIQDNNDDMKGYWILNYGNSNSIYGSIEFWLRSSLISTYQENFGINLLQKGSGITPISINDNGTWLYNNNFIGNYSEISDIPRLFSNNWHHIRIDYECSDGNYSGLGLNQWRIIVNGLRSPNLKMQLGTFPNNDVAFLDSLQILSGTPSNISIFCDGIGYYNGAGEYQLGENTVPQLFDYRYIKTIEGRKPSVMFDDGSYLAYLTVQNDLIAESELNIEIQSISPIISVPSRKYSGANGKITVTAYAWDSNIDKDILEYDWFFDDKRVLIETCSLTSSIEIFCSETRMIKGHVIVRDSSDLSAKADFFVDVFMDRDGDNLSNEYEILNNETTNDNDNDGLPNYFETLIETDPDNWDTDSDGLSDGWNYGSFKGEFSIRTSPRMNDTDSDELLDGFEWFGWNVTINTKDGPQLYYYSSSPLSKDTDGDKLLDNEEYFYKTDPRNADTDNDALSDYLEIYKFKSDPTNPDSDGDGLIESLEMEIGTLYNNSDTDDDGIPDGVEHFGWDYKTDPLKKDTDGDFIIDSEEIFTYEYKIDGRKDINETSPVSLNLERTRGEKQKLVEAAQASISFLLSYGELVSSEQLSDVRVQIYQKESNLVLLDEIFEMKGEQRYISKSFSIKEKIEGSGISYYGEYVLKVIFINEIHGDLCLEEYSINIAGYLDPSLNDYDGDGILDGIETQLLVRGSNILKYDDILNITSGLNSSSIIFDLEINDIGVVYDSNINFAISSESTLQGSGSVAVKVIQHQLDYRIKDIPIHYSNISFSQFEDFFQEYSIKPINDYPYDFPGTYSIKINILDTYENDVFNLADISVEIDGYREAILSDIDAWITKPNDWDSDDDGWDDYYEIYLTKTNPLKKDTDGDSIIDPYDLDPLYNIMLEIEFVEGHVAEMPTWYLLRKKPPVVQMTVDYWVHDEHYAFISPDTVCSKDLDKSSGLFKINYLGTAVFNDKYYLDVEDDISSIYMDFRLWNEGIGDTLWDTYRMHVSYTHDFSEFERDEYYDSGKRYGDYDPRPAHSEKDWIWFRVKTVGYGHVNTIAIFDNDTTFKGRYFQDDRMNIIELKITDTPSSSSPFVFGNNVILIPANAFIHTELNSMLLDAGEFSSSLFIGKNGQYMTLNRREIPETASNSIENIFGLECTISEAEELLDLTLFGVINLSTLEIGILNSYTCTKLDNIPTRLLNLHPDVLILIPYLGPDNPNVDQGDKPIPLHSWLAKKAELFLDVIVGIITGDLRPIVALIKDLRATTKDLLGPILSVPFDILFFAPLEFGITAMVTVHTYSIVGTVFVIINEVMIVLYAAFATNPNCIVVYTGNRLDVTGDFNFQMGYDTTYVDDPYLDIPLPKISFFYDSVDLELGFYFHYTYDDLNFTLFRAPSWLTSDILQDIIYLIDNMGDTMNELTGGHYTALGLTSKAIPYDRAATFLANLGVWGVRVGYHVYVKYNEGNEQDKEWVHLGVSLGFFISGLCAVFADIIGPYFSKHIFVVDKNDDYKLKLNSFFKKVKGVLGFGSIIGNLLSQFGVSTNFQLFDMFKAVNKLFKGFTACAKGCVFLSTKDQGALMAKLVLGISYLSLGGFFMWEFFN